MASTTTLEPGFAVVRDLVRLLHRDAPSGDYARRLADVEALPGGHPGKAALVELVRMTMAVHERITLHQERERGLLAVIESAQELSSRLDHNELLRAIVSRARNLVGSDLGWLSIYDAERDGFQVLVADGALAVDTASMVTRRDQGVASVVMSTRLPFTTADYLHDKRFAHDARLDDAFRAEGIAALVGVPLLWEGAVVGLLFVADRYHRMHTAQSIAILCALATHGAVALKNARDFGRVHAALEKADRARDELERHVKDIQAATDAHEQLTSLLARGASLSTLCQTVAELLGAGMLVLDEAGEVVSRGTAASYAGRGAQAYAPHGEHGVDLARALRDSRQAGRSVVAYDADGETCRAMPVIGGADVLGSALLFHRGPLSEVSVRTFERSSSIVGIVLLSQERMEATKSRGMAALLRALVSPRQDEPALLVDGAERHGLDLATSLTLTLIETDGPGAGHAARRLRMLPTFANTLVDEIDGLVVVLCATTKALDVRRAMSASGRTHLGPRHRGVQSRPVNGPAEVPALYATLRRAVTVLGRLGIDGHVVGQNELALYSTLFETHDASSLATFLDTTIGPLTQHDARRGSSLTATLHCYFDCNQNAKSTAQRLDIHVNTVRQRLATIESLLGHWGNASRALEIHVALRLWSLRSPSG